MFALVDLAHGYDFKFAFDAAVGFARMIDPTGYAVGVAPFAFVELDHMIEQVIIPLLVVESKNRAVERRDNFALAHGGLGKYAPAKFFGLFDGHLTIVHLGKRIT